MKKPTPKIEQVAPSKGLIPEALKDQFEWRQSNNYNGKNHLLIGDVLEPFWWNRPLHSDTLLRKEADGLYSCNLPYLFGVDSFKTKYNILVNKNSIPICVHIEINPKWTNSQIDILFNMAVDSIYEILIVFGVDPDRLTKVKNDILYDGKKFMGDERILRDGVFSENLVVTLCYKPEEEIFKRLTGKYALKRGICGILEETNKFTRDQFIKALCKKLKETIAILY